MLKLIRPLPVVLPGEWQKLMDLFYNEWHAQTEAMAQKPEAERERVNMADIAALMPAKVNIAVMLGNLNYQVHNGGWAQWIDNGYYTAGPTIAHYLKQAMALGQEGLAPIIEALDCANHIAKESDGGEYFDDDGAFEGEENWDKNINTQFWDANPEEELDKALAQFETIHGLNNYASAFQRAA